MSLHRTQEPCFYGSVSKQASQQDIVVQMSRGRSLTQPSEQSNKLNSLSLQSCCAKTLQATSTSVAESIVETKHAVKGQGKEKPTKEIFLGSLKTQAMQQKKHA